MLFEFLVLFVALLATVVLYLLAYARKHYGELEKLGIPVVKPHFFLGSNPNFTKIHSHFLDLEWFNTYGEIFGAYEGRNPYVFVCDPDIVKQIVIKDFDHFRNHSIHDLFGDNCIFNEMLDLLNDEKWRVARSLMSPAFTTSKLKRMSVVMNTVLQEYVAQTKEDLKKCDNGALEVNPYDEVFTTLTDLVARITLNIKIANPKDPNNDFAKALKALFSATVPDFIMPYTRAFPFLNKYFRSSKVDKDVDFFADVFRKVMNERKKSGQREDDFIDFFNDFRDKTEKDDELKKLEITEATVIANAVEFYIAGQDSMSTAFTMLCYYLTCNPDIEKRLYEELDTYAKKHNGKVDHDTFGDLPYLNACLTETLRLHPVFYRAERLCNKDWEYKGLKIKKGMTVVVPLWAYHRNPKYFPNPEKFDPERFMPYNKEKLDPMTFFTFGHGPRMCIGMRFSFECLTMISIHILRSFQFKARSDTNATYIPGLQFTAMIAPMKLDIVERVHSK